MVPDVIDYYGVSSDVMHMTTNFKVDAIYDGMSVSQGHRCIYYVM